MSKRHRRIEAAKPISLEGERGRLPLAGAATWVQAAAGDAPGLPKFSMVAYTGGPMALGWWEHPVVVDLAGMTIRSQALPIRRGHDAMLAVGHTESVAVEGGQVVASGVISFKTAAAQEIIEAAKNGFPWQASIGASIDSMEFVPEGMQAEVNGKTHEGPVYVARKTRLEEMSFVDIGADRETSVRVAAKAKTQEEEPNMLTEEQKKAIRAARAALKAGKITEALKAIEAHAEVDHEDFVAVRTEIEAAQAKKTPVETPAQADREVEALELERRAGVKAAAKGNDVLAARGIREGWNLDRMELEVLRAERPAAPAVRNSGSEPVTGDVLEAAALMAGGVSQDLLVSKHRFKKEVVEAADTRFKGRIGLQEMLLEAAWANGYAGRSFRSDPKGVLRAAFSTLSLPGIFSNVMNKRLEEGFMAVESGWKTIAAKRSVNDFKTVSSYRLSGAMQYERVAPDGEIKHGELGEETYSNKAETYGKMFSITRQDIINDDLGALTQVPMRLGRGAALALNEVFWTEWVGAETAGFFSAGNLNLDATTASLFGVDGLTLAERKFLDQIDPDGKPLGLAPAIILVPNALSTAANQVMKATELRDTTASTKFVTNNPHAGKFEVVRSSYLNNPAIPGGSAKHWYLVARPADMAAIEVAFLNGQEMPTVETAEADFNTLGIQARGFHDFGVALQEPRAAQKLRGEA